MTLAVRKLIHDLEEIASQVPQQALGKLLNKAADVIRNQQDDLEALRQQGTDHA